MTSRQSVAIKQRDKLLSRARDKASLQASASRVAGSEIPSNTLALAAINKPLLSLQIAPTAPV